MEEPDVLDSGEEEVLDVSPEHIQHTIQQIRKVESRSRKKRKKLLDKVVKYIQQVFLEACVNDDLMVVVADHFDLFTTLFRDTMTLLLPLSEQSSDLEMIGLIANQLSESLESFVSSLHNWCVSEDGRRPFVVVTSNFLTQLLTLAAENSDSWFYSTVIGSSLSIILWHWGADEAWTEHRAKWSKDFVRTMYTLARKVERVGDFFCQYGLVILIQLWLRWVDRGVAATFMKTAFSVVDSSVRRILLDDEQIDFDHGARNFLNELNSCPHGLRLVDSVPCEYIFSGDIEIKPPSAEENLDGYWVDFSSLSRRIHILCSVPDHGWVDLNIRADQIDSICVSWVRKDKKSQSITQRRNDTQMSNISHLAYDSLIFLHIYLKNDFSTIAKELEVYNGTSHRSLFIVFKEISNMERILSRMRLPFHKCGEKYCGRPKLLNLLVKHHNQADSSFSQALNTTNPHSVVDIKNEPLDDEEQFSESHEAIHLNEEVEPDEGRLTFDNIPVEDSMRSLMSTQVRTPAESFADWNQDHFRIDSPCQPRYDDRTPDRDITQEIRYRMPLRTEFQDSRVMDSPFNESKFIPEGIENNENLYVEKSQVQIRDRRPLGTPIQSRQIRVIETPGGFYPEDSYEDEELEDEYQDSVFGRTGPLNISTMTAESIMEDPIPRFCRNKVVKSNIERTPFVQRTEEERQTTPEKLSARYESLYSKRLLQTPTFTPLTRNTTSNDVSASPNGRRCTPFRYTPRRQRIESTISPIEKSIQNEEISDDESRFPESSFRRSKYILSSTPKPPARSHDGTSPRNSPTVTESPIYFRQGTAKPNLDDSLILQRRIKKTRSIIPSSSFKNVTSSDKSDPDVCFDTQEIINPTQRRNKVSKRLQLTPGFHAVFQNNDDTMDSSEGGRNPIQRPKKASAQSFSRSLENIDDQVEELPEESRTPSVFNASTSLFDTPKLPDRSIGPPMDGTTSQSVAKVQSKETSQPLASPLNTTHPTTTSALNLESEHQINSDVVIFSDDDFTCSPSNVGNDSKILIRTYNGPINISPMAISAESEAQREIIEKSNIQTTPFTAVTVLDQSDQGFSSDLLEATKQQSQEQTSTRVLQKSKLSGTTTQKNVTSSNSSNSQINIAVGRNECLAVPEPSSTPTLLDENICTASDAPKSPPRASPPSSTSKKPSSIAAVLESEYYINSDICIYSEEENDNVPPPVKTRKNAKGLIGGRPKKPQTRKKNNTKTEQPVGSRKVPKVLQRSIQNVLPMKVVNPVPKVMGRVPCYSREASFNLEVSDKDKSKPADTQFVDPYDFERSYDFISDQNNPKMKTYQRKRKPSNTRGATRAKKKVTTDNGQDSDDSIDVILEKLPSKQSGRKPGGRPTRSKKGDGEENVKTKRVLRVRKNKADGEESVKPKRVRKKKGDEVATESGTSNEQRSRGRPRKVTKNSEADDVTTKRQRRPRKVKDPSPLPDIPKTPMVLDDEEEPMDIDGTVGSLAVESPERFVIPESPVSCQETAKSYTPPTRESEADPSRKSPNGTRHIHKVDIRRLNLSPVKKVAENVPEENVKITTPPPRPNNNVVGNDNSEEEDWCSTPNPFRSNPEDSPLQGRPSPFIGDVSLNRESVDETNLSSPHENERMGGHSPSGYSEYFRPLNFSPISVSSVFSFAPEYNRESQSTRTSDSDGELTRATKRNTHSNAKRSANDDDIDYDAEEVEESPYPSLKTTRPPEEKATSEVKSPRKAVTEKVCNPDPDDTFNWDDLDI